MTGLVELLPPPGTPTVTVPLNSSGGVNVPADAVIYANTLLRLILPAEDLNATDFVFRNAGTLWNFNELDSFVWEQRNWGWIYNSGTIVAQAASGWSEALGITSVWFGGLINTGSIYAVTSNSAASNYNYAMGFYLFSDGLIQNSGIFGASGNHARTVQAYNGAQIVNAVGGSFLAEGSDAIAILLGRGHSCPRGWAITTVDVTNSGLIEARSTSASSSSIGLSLANISGESMVAQNFGVIRADVAIYASHDSTSEELSGQQIINELTGWVDGNIDLRRANAFIVNRGQISGDIALGVANDLVTNSGTIMGSVALGAGRDVYWSASGIQNGNVFGEDGADLLIGGAGRDYLDGGAGNDVIFGAGGDTLTGGAGRDAFVFSLPTVGQVVETITDFASGTDVIDLRQFAPTSLYIAGSTLTAVNALGTLTVQSSGSISNSDILTSDGVTNPTSGDDTLVSGIVAANFHSGNGNDLLVGSTGADVLDGGTGADAMWGGSGNDLYVVDNNGDLVVELAEAGTDTVNAFVSYTLPSGVENLTLMEGVFADGGGNELNNVLIGNSTSNHLNGGAGDDLLIGGATPDVLAGGTGSDTFRDTAANLSGDTIMDFARGERILVVDAWAGMNVVLSDTLPGSLLTIGSGTLTLPSLHNASLTISAAPEGGMQIAFDGSTIIISAASVDLFN